MESVTGITVLDAYLANRAKDLQVESIEITKIEDFPLYEEMTGLAPSIANSILKESSATNELLLIHGYEIISCKPLNVTVKINNDTIISSDELKKDFEEPFIVEPSREVEVKESHALGTIPIKVKVNAVRYVMEAAK